MPTEEEIKISVFHWLKENSVLNGNVFSRQELETGFNFRGKTISLAGPRGIWIPKGFSTPISITSTSGSPYKDFFTDDGFLTY